MIQDPVRHLYLICYDISNVKIARAVRKILVGYRVSGQKSVFECWMTISERKHTIKALEVLMDEETDRLHIFRMDPRQKHEYFGVSEKVDINAFYIL